MNDLTRPFLLQFCQPVRNAVGGVATAPEGSVEYSPQSCSPIRTASGSIDSAVTYVPWSASISLRDIVWEPATASVGGKDVELSSFLVASIDTGADGQGGTTLTLKLNEQGKEVLKSVAAERSSEGLPLAMFLDGELLRQGNGDIVTTSAEGQPPDHLVIAGLTNSSSSELQRQLDLGSFPIPMRVSEASGGGRKDGTPDP